MGHAKCTDSVPREGCEFGDSVGEAGDGKGNANETREEEMSVGMGGLAAFGVGPYKGSAGNEETPF